MFEYRLSAGTAASNSIPKSALISEVVSSGIISSFVPGGSSTIFFPDTEEEQEERLWDKALNSPHGQRTLDFLLAEAHREIEAGEFEESGFGLE